MNSNVSPNLSCSDLVDDGVVDPKLLRQFVSGRASGDVSASYFLHLILGKLRSTVLFSLGGLNPVFEKGVSHVLPMTSTKKMVWPPARRVVAFVTNLHFTTDWTTEQSPCEPVSCPSLPLELDVPISGNRVATSGPFPAWCAEGTRRDFAFFAKQLFHLSFSSALTHDP